MARRNATAYANSMFLSDDRELKISYTTWGDGPDADSSETVFFIDGVEVERNELPEEVSAEDIRRLELYAKRDANYDWGGPDYD